MSELPYYKIPDPPETMNAQGVLIRLIDSLGFRYRWATEGLREEDMMFQACDTSKRIWEVLAHIHGLVTITDAYLTGRDIQKIEPISLEERRKKTLELIVSIREALLGLDDDYLASRMYRVPWSDRELPLWYLINGPMSDALTHVGQVAAWRRQNGNPILDANVFFGTPPK